MEKNKGKKAVLRFMCFLMVCLLSFCVIGSTEAEAASKKVSVSMKNSGATIKKGNKVSVKATLNNATAKKTTYSSSNKKVATVSGSGVVTAKKAGTAKITAKVTAKNGKTYSKTVKVTVKSSRTSKTPDIALSGKQTILKGNKATVSRTLKNSKSSISSTSYKSSKTSVATVNSSGVVTAKKAGTATITVTSKTKDGHTLIATRKITVKSSASSKYSYINVSPTSKSLQVGRTQNISTTLKNAGGTKISSTSYKSSKTSVATVNSSGKITAKKAGTATITVTAKTKDKQQLIKTIKVTVKDCTSHSYTTTSTTKPTCTATGKTVKTCKYCGKQTTTTTAATGHTAGDWEITKEATITSTGTRVKKCTTCGTVVQTETIPKLTCTDHDYVTTTTPATCTTDGKTVKTCKICGDTVTTTIPATGHNYREISNTATCTESGKITEECTICGDTRTYNTTKIDHDMVTTRTEPNCRSAGFEKEICSMCGKGSSTVIPATGHNLRKTTNSDGSWNLNCQNDDCTEHHYNIRDYTVDLGNGKTTTVTGYYREDISNEIVKLLNEYRVENGLNELVVTDIMQQGADIRGAEIAHSFSHTRPNGVSLDYVVDGIMTNGSLGENIMSCPLTYKDAFNAEAMMNAWKASDGHNQAMLRSSYKTVGVSVFWEVDYDGEELELHGLAVQIFSM